MLKRLVISLAGACVAATTAAASDIDDARNAFRDQGDMACVQQGGGTIDVDWKAVDLNGDGQNEFVVVVGGYGNGTSGCFGQAGATAYLMTKTSSGWRQEFGVPGIDLDPISRGRGQWADLRIAGPGFCFPVWRNDGAGYDLFKSC